MRAFLRSRHLLGGCVCAVLAALLGVWVRGVWIRADSALETSGGTLTATAVALIVTTCSAAATGRERAALRRLGPLRVGAVLAVVAVAALPHALLPDGQVAGYLRSVAGLSGLGLIAAQAVSARLAWGVLVPWIAAPPFLFDTAEADSTRLLTFWAWPLADAGSWCVALGLGVLGLGALARRPSRR